MLALAGALSLQALQLGLATSPQLLPRSGSSSVLCPWGHSAKSLMGLPAQCPARLACASTVVPPALPVAAALCCWEPPCLIVTPQQGAVLPRD